MALEQGTGWTPPTWTLGDRLRKAREMARLEMQDVTAESGVPAQSIGPWERGARTPQRGTLARVAAVYAPRLRTNVDELVEWIVNG